MRRVLVFGLGLVTAGIVSGLPGPVGERPAHAADITDLASSFDDDNVFDFRFRVRYDHTEKRAQIKREAEGITPDQDQLLTFKDLRYKQVKDQMALRVEIGLFHDLQLSAELPIILNQVENYTYDQSSPNGCTFPETTSTPSCVDATNSTTVRDGIIPVGGFDAQHSGQSLGGAGVFQGPQRGAIGGSGADAFDTINLALTWAPVNQRRDDTKPTWTIGFEGDISIGNIMQFDRLRPNANHAVSEGVHRLFARSTISKRFRYFDPYIGFWYMYPIARGDSLYKDYGPAQKTKNPQQQAGTVFGVEMVAYEKPADSYKFAIDLRGRIEGHFNGKGYSELWEVLASSPALGCDTMDNHAAYNLACDPSLTKNAYQNQPYTGITTIENYATLGADVGLTGQVGKHAHFRVGMDYTHDASHLITNDDIGTPLNGDARVTLPAEFNPAYRAVIDQPGRRYRVDNVNAFDIYVSGQLMF